MKHVLNVARRHAPAPSRVREGETSHRATRESSTINVRFTWPEMPVPKRSRAADETQKKHVNRFVCSFAYTNMVWFECVLGTQ